MALFPAASRIVPEFNARVFAEIASPSSSVSPDATVYDNTIDAVPDPDAYVAYFVDNPCNCTRGDPVTVTASENVTVTLTMSPVIYVPSDPADEENATDDTVGAVTSAEPVVASVVLDAVPAPAEFTALILTLYRVFADKPEIVNGEVVEAGSTAVHELPALVEY